MRQNLTKKEIINSIYMQLGFSKNLIENILEDIFEILLETLKEKGKVKVSNFGTFELRHKKSGQRIITFSDGHFWLSDKGFSPVIEGILYPKSLWRSLKNIPLSPILFDASLGCIECT